jgi:hypothetical protein
MAVVGVEQCRVTQSKFNPRRCWLKKDGGTALAAFLERAEQIQPSSKVRTDDVYSRLHYVTDQSRDTIYKLYAAAGKHQYERFPTKGVCFQRGTLLKFVEELKLAGCLYDFDALEQTLESALYTPSDKEIEVIRQSVTQKPDSTNVDAAPGQIGVASTSSSDSLSAQLAQSLWSLDCRTQRFEVEDRLTDRNRTIALLLRSSSGSVQQWLTKLLASDVNGFSGGTHYPIRTQTHPLRHEGIQALWQELARSLFGNAFNHELLADDVISSLSEQCRTKSVFIALYGVERLTPDCLLSIIQDFWLPLVKEVEAQSISGYESRLVLMLTTSKMQGIDSCCEKIIPICPLESIEPDDIKRWFSRLDNPLDLPEQYLSRVQKAKQLLSSADNHPWDRVDSWETMPDWVLNEICFAFGMEDGIRELEQYWTLSA